MAATLLERLRAPRGPSDGTADLRASVLAHLQEMFGARRGAMLTCPDYGLPDFNELVHQFPEAIGVMSKALEAIIAKYEPRLTGVRVQHVPSSAFDLIVRFEVYAELVNGSKRERVRFETRIDSRRDVRVM